MRTTVTLDKDVYDAVLHLSRASGKRLGKVLSEVARRGMKAPDITVRRKGRFPVVDVPPDAPMIALESIRKFLDEEGHF
jgi:hypothetical protein